MLKYLQENIVFLEILHIRSWNYVSCECAKYSQNDPHPANIN